MLGNLFEHYDAALFSLLSPFLAPLFFPNHDPLTALIFTYCIIPLGMMARPLGALIFGYIGDTHGRKEALALSLSGMAIITGLMGFLPTYFQVGILAPILLSIGRIFQNFFTAGEVMGGAIYLLENSPESQKNMISSLYDSSKIAGVLLASAGVSILCCMNSIQDYWRILYFSGCFTAVFVAFLRVKVSFNSFFALSSHTTESSLKFILKSCWKERQALMAIAVASGFSYASYTLSLVMMNGFVPLVSNVSKTEMMHLNTILLGTDFVLLPLFGILSNKFSREKMMMLSGVIAMISGFPLFWLINGASLTTVICIRLLLVMIGVWFSAPFHAWSQTLVSAPHRYTVISFGYALGSQILGGPTAAISLWLFQKTNWIVSAGWYWMILGLLASYCVYKQKALAENLHHTSYIPEKTFGLSENPGLTGNS